MSALELASYEVQAGVAYGRTESMSQLSRLKIRVLREARRL